MLRDQMIGFLQTAIVFLLLTNAVSALVAFYAMKTANVLVRPSRRRARSSASWKASLSALTRWRAPRCGAMKGG